MSAYASQLQFATSLLKRKGAVCTWKRTSAHTDPAKPWNEVATTVDEYTVDIVFLPFDSVSRRMFGYADGTSMPAGTMVGYMAGQTTFTPQLRDQIAVGTKTYTVAAIDEINPDHDQAVLYIMELRR